MSQDKFYTTIWPAGVSACMFVQNYVIKQQSMKQQHDICGLQSAVRNQRVTSDALFVNLGYDHLHMHIIDKQQTVSLSQSLSHSLISLCD